MAKRKIVSIDQEKCNGCGLCIPNCAEGAIQIIDGKARLISEKFCDGLGACLGHCPEDAITIAERDADEFDEKAVEVHLHKTKEHEAKPKIAPLFAGCPSSRSMQFKTSDPGPEAPAGNPSPSMLSHWPVQLRLVPIHAPYFENADLLIAADCVPFAYSNFHQDFLKGKAVVIGCPKLDDIEYYREKLTEIFRTNSIKSITLPFMEVPCCYGLVKATEDALKASGKDIPIKKVKISIRGDALSEDQGLKEVRMKAAK